ncbi:hypothetical protein H4R24_000775 [Coemansia sp. RSA 988]|nr:hypothetical protein H4R24_000775 [Coemansia sp. RSA 988]
MTVIERKRSADSVACVSEGATQGQPLHHPCFWGVLDGEHLSFLFVSASLHMFLGSDRAAAMLGRSLFDYVHPEEANHARRDLADGFISKSFVGSSTRCRLMRFDMESPGLHHVFRRASESQILHRGRPAQHVHEAFERKLSLPTIPDIAKVRANGPHHQHHPPLAQQQHTAMHQPMPKRLRTILEDADSHLAPAWQLPGKGNITCDDRESRTSSSSIADGRSGEINSGSEYLIANVALYLVSARLSVMVCHYEDPQPGVHASELSAVNSNSEYLPVARCDCCSSAPMGADSERLLRILAQAQRLDAIAPPRTFAGMAAQALQGLSAGGGSGGNSNAVNRDNNGSGGGRGSNISSRHVQVYSIDTERLLCSFPEDVYRRLYGRTPAEASKAGAQLCGLWEHCHSKKADIVALLQGPCTPGANPIRLELNVRPNSPGGPADVQCLFFRWGHLLFVSQQAYSDSTPDSGAIGTVGIEDNILASYNLTTPPRDDFARGALSPDGTSHPVPGLVSGNSRCRGAAGKSLAPLGVKNRPPVLNSSPLNPATVTETRPFSHPRAPASVVACLPPRTVPVSEPPEAVPPRRQSSYTLPPAKTFEERRFSYPIQALYSEHRPPPLPIPPQQHQHQQQQQQVPTAASMSPAGMTPGSGSVMRGGSATSSPGGRLAEMRQRSTASGGIARMGGSLLGKDGATQPTPTISPMSAVIVHHTPVSLSPAPQSQVQLQPHSANPGHVQVNVYPPPDTGAWRWGHGHHALSQPPTPGHAYPVHVYGNSAPRAPPPIAQGRPTHSPHMQVFHSSIHDRYHSPIGSAGVSPMAGPPPPAHRGDTEKKMCKSCGTDSSPEWRKGPTGHKT